LQPKKIIVVSSAPQIRYPDCYGIDMSKMGEFVAFEAMISLLKEQGGAQLIQDTYQACVQAKAAGTMKDKNLVQALYAHFSDEEISKRIAQIVTPAGIHAEVEVIYQTLGNLHLACPKHLGDWYFSGNYPTPGGNKVVNQAFMNWVEGNNQRAY
jgi:amidophosphoribosyltransferase